MIDALLRRAVSMTIVALTIPARIVREAAPPETAGPERNLSDAGVYPPKRWWS